MASERDFNVPVAGSCQMRQALRFEGMPTQLVISPKQFHGISNPSYRQTGLSDTLYHLDLISSPKDYAEILNGIIPIENYFRLNTGIIGIKWFGEYLNNRVIF